MWTPTQYYNMLLLSVELNPVRVELQNELPANSFLNLIIVVIVIIIIFGNDARIVAHDRILMLSERPD